MEGFGGLNFEKKHTEQPIPISLEDFQDSPEVFQLLARLPQELRVTHMSKVEDMDDQEAVEYLQSIHEKREAAARESRVSDPSLQDYFEKHADTVWNDLENDVFRNASNQIGAG